MHLKGKEKGVLANCFTVNKENNTKSAQKQIFINGNRLPLTDDFLSFIAESTLFLEFFRGVLLGAIVAEESAMTL